VDEWTLLTWSTINNKIEIVKLLLSYKDIDINCQNKWKDTVLILALKYNKIDIIKILLNRSEINIFLKDCNNKTVLDIAKIRNNKEIKNLLNYYNMKQKLKLII
jgi:ankyrin repeat protein